MSSWQAGSPIDAAGHVVVHCDADQPIDLDVLRGVLTQPGTIRWSATTVAGDESFDRLWLRLTGTEAGTCRIAASPKAIETNLCGPRHPLT